MWSLLEKGICRKIWKENIEMLIVISLRVRLEVILSYILIFLLFRMFYLQNYKDSFRIGGDGGENTVF